MSTPISIRLYESRITNFVLLINRSQDMIGALRHVIKMQDHSVMVDLLGAIIEKP